MVSKPFQRPFSLATRLTFFISLATIAAFFAFAWIMIHSVKVHFAEQDINDLKEISATLERVLNHPDETQARRLMTLEDIVSGYSNVLISLADSQGKTVYHSPGTPIAPEHLPRLFDRFYRVDPSRQRKGEGSGIGLAIVKSIVVAHKGTVAVTSDARGTRFVITLPA